MISFTSASLDCFSVLLSDPYRSDHEEAFIVLVVLVVMIGPNGENWGFEGVLVSFSYTFSRLFQV